MSTPSPIRVDMNVDTAHRDCGEYPLPQPQNENAARPITAYDVTLISLSVTFIALTVLRLCGLLG